MTPGNQFGGPPQQTEKKKTSTTVIVLVILGAGLCFVVPVIGILAAIAIPNFIKYQARAKQTECKVQLKALYTAQRSYHAEHDVFSTDAAELGFAPGPRARYSYFLAPEVGVAADKTLAKEVDQHPFALDREGIAVGVTGECPDCEFTAACVGNIDSDDTFDLWTVSSAERTGPNGMPIAPGQPFNDVNDLTER